MKNRSIGFRSIIFGMAFTLVACQDSSISSRDIYTLTYLFYTSGAASASTLATYAVDPKDPGSPVQIDASAVTDRVPAYVLAGTVESAGGTIADLHYRNIIYTRGTNIYKVDARRSGSLVPTRVSSEANADRICDPFGGSYSVGKVFEDYQNPDRSVMFYNIENAADATPCPNNSADGDEILYMVRLGMDSTTAPLGGLTNYFPVSPVYSSDGSLTGFILLNLTTQDLRLYNYNLTSSTSLLTGVVSAFHLAVAPSGNILLGVETAGSTDFYIFKASSLTLTSSLHTIASSIDQSLPADDNYFYFGDGDIIYRLAINGNSSASIVIDDSATGTRQSSYLSVSRNNLIYIVDDSTNYLVRTVPASGGSASTIFSMPDTTSLRSFRSAAGRIYFTYFSGAVRRAISINDTGGDTEVIANAAWTGFTYHPRQRLFADIDILGRLNQGYPMARMKPNVIFQAQYSSSGVSFSSFDADTTAKLVDYGIPAADFGDYSYSLQTFPPVVHALATQFQTLVFFTGASSNDVLFLHSKHGGSIVRVTNDSTDDVHYGIIGGCSIGAHNRFDPLLPILILISVLFLLRHRLKRILIR